MKTIIKNTTALFILLSIFHLSTTFAQNTKTYDFKDFNSIEIGGAFTGEITQGDEFKVTVEYEESMEENLDLKQVGNELKVGLKGWKSSGKSSPKIIIQLPALEKLDLSGACDIILVKLSGENLEIELSGASSLQGDLDFKRIEIDASGASSIGFSGRTNKIELYLSGASNFKGKGLIVTDEFLLDCSGASSARCQVDGDMFIKMSGASSLQYTGEGNILKQELSGASEIEKL